MTQRFWTEKVGRMRSHRWGWRRLCWKTIEHASLTFCWPTRAGGTGCLCSRDLSGLYVMNSLRRKTRVPVPPLEQREGLFTAQHNNDNTWPQLSGWIWQLIIKTSGSLKWCSSPVKLSWPKVPFGFWTFLPTQYIHYVHRHHPGLSVASGTGSESGANPGILDTDTAVTKSFLSIFNISCEIWN